MDEHARGHCHKYESYRLDIRVTNLTQYITHVGPKCPPAETRDQTCPFRGVINHTSRESGAYLAGGPGAEERPKFSRRTLKG